MNRRDVDFTIPSALVARAVGAALEEDLGLAGDITTLATVPAGAMARAVIATRKPGVISGLALAGRPETLRSSEGLSKGPRKPTGQRR